MYSPGSIIVANLDSLLQIYWIYCCRYIGYIIVEILDRYCCRYIGSNIEDILDRLLQIDTYIYVGSIVADILDFNRSWIQYSCNRSWTNEADL